MLFISSRVAPHQGDPVENVVYWGVALESRDRDFGSACCEASQRGLRHEVRMEFLDPALWRVLGAIPQECALRNIAST